MSGCKINLSPTYGISRDRKVRSDGGGDRRGAITANKQTATTAGLVLCQ